MMRSAAVLLLLYFGYINGQSPYYGREVGKLSELHHGVRGRLYAIDSRTLFLRDFHYDGEGPTAYFYVGSSKAPGSGGSRLRDERGGVAPLRRYRGEDITLSLPDGKTLRDVKWFSVWCEEFTVNFGDVSIPRDLDYPKPVKVSALRGVHGVSSDPIVVVDAQTLLIPNFSYDGEAPDAKFWVGRGDKPSPQGIRIPDENGKENPLRKYDKKTIVLTLPGELTVFDIGHFAVWCEAFTVNFGHVSLPRHQLSNIPPSLKMLGVSPQSRNKELVKENQQSSSQHGPRGRPRRPLARLDATTYRPHLKPGAGPLAALLDPPADHTSLHRRADSYTPPAEQLLVKDKDSPDQKVAYDNQRDQQSQLQKQQEPLFVTSQDYRQDDQQQKNLFYKQETDQEEPSQNNYQTHTELSNRAQPYQTKPQVYQQNTQRNQDYQTENYQQQRSHELIYQDPYQNQAYYQPQYQNQQLINQQRAYEEQILNERYRQQQQQFLHPHYRLIPFYSQTGGRI